MQIPSSSFNSPLNGAVNRPASTPNSNQANPQRPDAERTAPQSPPQPSSQPPSGQQAVTERIESRRVDETSTSRDVRTNTQSAPSKPSEAPEQPEQPEQQTLGTADQTSPDVLNRADQPVAPSSESQPQNATTNDTTRRDDTELDDSTSEPALGFSAADIISLAESRPRNTSSESTSLESLRGGPQSSSEAPVQQRDRLQERFDNVGRLQSPDPSIDISV